MTQVTWEEAIVCLRSMPMQVPSLLSFELSCTLDYLLLEPRVIYRTWNLEIFPLLKLVPILSPEICWSDKVKYYVNSLATRKMYELVNYSYLTTAATVHTCICTLFQWEKQVTLNLLSINTCTVRVPYKDVPHMNYVYLPHPQTTFWKIEWL